MKIKLKRNTVARDATTGQPMVVLAGNIYDVTPADARLLIRMGAAEEVAEKKEPKQYEPADNAETNEAPAVSRAVYGRRR